MLKPTAVILGASGGLGHAFSEELIQYDLVKTYRSKIIKGGIYLDLTNPESFEELQNRLRNKSVELLINATGLYSEEPLKSAEDSDWINLLNNNVFGFNKLFNTIQKYLSVGCKIIFCGSDAGLSHQPGHPIYSISKWALESYIDNLADEYPSFRYFLVEFGNVATKFAKTRTPAMNPKIAIERALSAINQSEPYQLGKVERIFIGSKEELDFLLTDIFERLESIKKHLPLSQKEVFHDVSSFFLNMLTE